nr:restriction endonuclease [Pectobacterium quasiaquaticum]
MVCTSQYGKDAYRFCEDKPIELIDGGGLLYLLKEHAGVSARINPNF